MKGVFYLLAGRDSVVESVSSFYKNYKYSSQYPLHIFYFNENLNSNIIDTLKSINSSIQLQSIKTIIPKNIEEIEFYYNRKNLGYVKTSFPKDRVEFLHMCDFLFNIFNSKLFNNFDYALRWDDDGLFKKKMRKDYFKVLSKSDKRALTGKLNYQAKIHHFETRINLFRTLLDYLKYYNVCPKCELLSHCFDLTKNPETYFIGEYTFHNTLYMTDFNVYDLSIFRSKYWENWNKHINESGGIYKYRWGENELITLFIRIHYGDVINDLDLWPDLYDPKGADENTILRIPS